MLIPILDEQQIFANLHMQKNPFFEEYYAFYSSWFGGIVTNPRLMLLPIDDHMVHRGDGIFEAIQAVDRTIYLFEEHLQRLLRSAEQISLKLPFSLEQMKEIIIETLRVANHDTVMIRIYLSRGPGNFSVNPYDSVASQFYVMITALRSPPAEKYQKGVVIGKSAVPFKGSWMAQVKSCNYLANVMMKKEAVDRQLDFVIGTDDNATLTEGATENLMMVDTNGIVVHPPFGSILKGTTMIRACELARENGLATAAREISLDDLHSAREVMMAGTSLTILPVVEFEGKKIGNGEPGPITKKLREFLLADMQQGAHRTFF